MNRPKRMIILVLIVGFLFSCGSPRATKVDGDAMASLASLLFLCQALSRLNSEAECTFINLERFGVVESTGLMPNPDINIQIAIIDHKFFATGSHFQSETVYSLDASGKVAPIPKGA